jgi:hypothetical protein
MWSTFSFSPQNPDAICVLSHVVSFAAPGLLAPPKPATHTVMSSRRCRRQLSTDPNPPRGYKVPSMVFLSAQLKLYLYLFSNKNQFVHSHVDAFTLLLHYRKLRKANVYVQNPEADPCMYWEATKNTPLRSTRSEGSFSSYKH